MSADLFSEFNSLSASSSTQGRPNNSLRGQPESQASTSSSSRGLYNFTTSQNSGQITQPMPSWSSFPSSSNNNLSVWSQTTTQHFQPASAESEPADDNDAWGDFEVADHASSLVTLPASNSGANVLAQNTGNWASQSSIPNFEQSMQSIAPSYAKGVMADNLLDFSFVDAQENPTSESAWSPVEPKKYYRSKAAPSDPNVLFDADDFRWQSGRQEAYYIDEFGDFETVDPAPASRAPQPSPQTRNFDLLGLDDPPAGISRSELTEQQHNLAKHLSFGALSAKRPFTHIASLQNRSMPSKAQTQEPIFTRPCYTSESSGDPLNEVKNSATKTSVSWNKTPEDEEWAAWDDFPRGGGSSDTARASTTMVNKGTEEGWDWGERKGISAMSVTSDNIPPPTNVPPPSILLSVFPELLSSGDFLFKPVTGQTVSIKQQIFSNPKTINFLQGYLLIATTAARVIAGRKHRWHRDKILAKSMSISAAGSKGMKLAGIDKTQSAREDREAADIVASWKANVGMLRSAVASANSAAKADLTVPELTESPQIQTAKMVLTAVKPCVICGLKREERVTKVDFDVEDCFGEWWVDHWGHRACKNFWIEHEEKLRQR